jgi:DNA repair exonuclease SbcCD ATPase subunit
VIAALKLVPVWAWAITALIVALALAAVLQTLQLADVRAEYAAYRSDIDAKAAQAGEQARQTEQQRQRDIDQVRNDAAQQKQKDDALAAQQRADNDSLRDQTRKLLADRVALNSRLAARGKTIADLADLLAELRSEADGAAGELAGALTASRRAGLACERAYDSITH